jgi:hypothetical protein
MTERQTVIARLAIRDLAQSYAALGRHLSSRTQQGALADAGSPDAYRTVDDFRLALADFVQARLAHAPAPTLPER